MAVKFLTSIYSENEALQNKIAIVVDWFYTLKKLLEDSNRPNIVTCRCDLTKDLSVKIRCIGGTLMDWAVKGGVTKSTETLVDEQLTKFVIALNKLISVKISCDDPCTAALVMAKTEKPINVVFEAVESIVKFVKELLCVPACTFGKCQNKLDKKEKELMKLKEKVIYRCKSTCSNNNHANKSSETISLTISRLGKLDISSKTSEVTRSCCGPRIESSKNCPADKSETNCNQEQAPSQLNNSVSCHETNSPSYESRKTSVEDKNKIVKESVQKIINLLEKKRKWVKTDGLLQFVLWRESYREAKQVLNSRKSRGFRSSFRSRRLSLSAKFGSLTKLACFGKMTIPFYSQFD